MRKSQEPVKGSVFIEQQDRALSAPSFEKEWIESMIYWPGEKVSVQFLLVGRISTLLTPSFRIPRCLFLRLLLVNIALISHNNENF